MDNNGYKIYLAVFTFYRREVLTNKKIQSHTLVSGEFLLSDTPNKSSDKLYRSRALETKGITRSACKTKWAEWMADDVKVSCELIREIKGWT